MKNQTLGMRSRIASILTAIGAGQMHSVAPFEGELGVAPPRSLDALATYGVFVPDAVEVIRQPLYDRMVYDDAGITGSLRFFQQPQGQGNASGIGSTGQTKSLDDTNMEQAGSLPNPKMFLATSVEIIVEPGSISTANAWSPLDIAFLTNATSASVGLVPALNGANDINRILMSAWLKIYISSKDYLITSRADSFPPKSYICPDASVAQSVQLGHSGIVATRAVGRPFYLNPPLLLMPTVNFEVSLNWANAVATPTGMNARITCRLDGFLYRTAQ